MHYQITVTMDYYSSCIGFDLIPYPNPVSTLAKVRSGRTGILPSNLPIHRHFHYKLGIYIVPIWVTSGRYPTLLIGA